MESRIAELEEQVTILRISNASLSTSVEHLSGAVKDLSTTVKALNDTIQQGKGAARFALALAGFGGGTVGALIIALLRKVGIL